MELIHTKGIVLRTIRYSDTQEIHTLFTEHYGLLSVLNRIGKKERTPPLFEGDFSLKKGKNLFQLVDACQTVCHGPIRDKLDSIESAFKLFHYILKSQLQLKAAPALYHLFAAFLKHLPQITDKQAFESVFLSKLLFHEGHLDAENPTLLLLATLKSFKEIDQLTLSKEELAISLTTFEEIYGI